jgi:hypothetical protein
MEATTRGVRDKGIVCEAAVIAGQSVACGLRICDALAGE